MRLSTAAFCPWGEPPCLLPCSTPTPRPPPPRLSLFLLTTPPACCPARHTRTLAAYRSPCLLPSSTCLTHPSCCALPCPIDRPQPQAAHLQLGHQGQGQDQVWAGVWGNVYGGHHLFAAQAARGGAGRGQAATPPHPHTFDTAVAYRRICMHSARSPPLAVVLAGATGALKGTRVGVGGGVAPWVPTAKQPEQEAPG